MQTVYMEDITNILFIVAAVVFWAVGAYRKDKRRRQAAGNDSDNQDTSSEQPQMTSQPQPQRTHTVPIAEPQVRVKSARIAPKPVAKPESAAVPTTENAANNDDNGKNEGIAANFNLRDAVIYSEILRPKFDE